MTLEPLLLKTNEYCLHIVAEMPTKLPYFKPDSATYKPWSFEKGMPQGLALATLKQIERNFPKLKLFVLRAGDYTLKLHSKIQDVCTTISIIQTGCKAKISNAPTKVCSIIYKMRVDSLCAKIFRGVNELSLIEIAYKIDGSLLPLKDFEVAKQMRTQVKAMAPSVHDSARFTHDKSVLLSKISIIRVHWRLKVLGKEISQSKDDKRMEFLLKIFEDEERKFFKHANRHPTLYFKSYSKKIEKRMIYYDLVAEAFHYKMQWKQLKNCVTSLFT